MMSEDFDERISLRPAIGITIGDPAGIGPEISLHTAIAAEILATCVPVLIGDAQYLLDWAVRFGIQTDFHILQPGESIPRESQFPLIYNISNLTAPIQMGIEQAMTGQAAGQYIETAVQLCLQGQLHAITTAPLNKKALHMGGYDFPGHTEMLAHLTNTTEFAMSFVAPNLRVALLTTHVPLSEITNYVKKQPLINLIQLVQRELQRQGIAKPRIAVAALNPHGGEGGLFGNEEILEMAPAIAYCQQEAKIDVSGPHSGDTIFLRAARGEFDLVISCYHDQGLIPIKCFAFGAAVNVTLGLPFIRTSVDHGTAFDIAGQGKADVHSMITATKLAADLVRQAQAAH